MESEYDQAARLRMAAFEEWAKKYEPTPEEVSAWTQAERDKRRQWQDGPSAEEIQEWTRRTKWRRAHQAALDPAAATLSPPDMSHWWSLYREVELAALGAISCAFTAPGAYWQQLVRAGYAWERSRGPQTRDPGRVPYPGDK